jgi:hypothetical protein
LSLPPQAAFADVGALGNFVENHDQTRWLLTNPDQRSYQNGLVAAFFLPVRQTKPPLFARRFRMTNEARRFAKTGSGQTHTEDLTQAPFPFFALHLI